MANPCFLSRFVFFVALLPSMAWSAQVLKVGKDMRAVAVSHDAGTKWAVGESVCVQLPGGRSACGRVAKSAPKGAIVRLDKPSADVVVGSRVIRKASAPSASKAAEPAAPLLETRVSPVEAHSIWSISAGGVATTSSFYPMVSGQWAFTRNFSVGLGGMYLSSSSATGVSLSTLGFLAQIQFFSEGAFQGFWVHAAGGLAMMSASGTGVSESATTLLAIGTLGWRWMLTDLIGVGVGAGVHYLGDPAFSSVTTTATGVKPVATVDFSLCF